jgi:hypothetical protein
MRGKLCEPCSRLSPARPISTAESIPEAVFANLAPILTEHRPGVPIIPGRLGAAVASRRLSSPTNLTTLVFQAKLPGGRLDGRYTASGAAVCSRRHPRDPATPRPRDPASPYTHAQAQMRLGHLAEGKRTPSPSPGPIAILPIDHPPNTARAPFSFSLSFLFFLILPSFPRLWWIEHFARHSYAFPHLGY